MKTEEQILKEFCADIRSETVPDDVFQTLKNAMEFERKRLKFRNICRFVFRIAASGIVILGLGYSLVSNNWGKNSRSWKVAGVSASRRHQPIIRKKRIITLKGSESNLHVVILDKKSGKTLWESSFAVSSHSLGADHKRVFAWTTDALVALSINTGAELWKYEPERIYQPFEKNLSVIGNTVCWTEAGRIFVLNTDTGQLAWKHKTDAGKLSVPVGNHNNLYTATKDCLLAFDRKTGKMKWEHHFRIRGIRFFDPIVKCDRNGVYVAQRSIFGKATIMRIDMEAGQTQWSREIEGTLQSLSVKDNVYVKTERLEVFDGITGNLLWTAPVNGCAPPTPVDHRVYVVEGRGSQKIRALDIKTGMPLWTRKLADSCNGLIVSGGMAFLNGHDGILYALDVDDHG